MRKEGIKSTVHSIEVYYELWRVFHKGHYLQAVHQSVKLAAPNMCTFFEQSKG